VFIFFHFCRRRFAAEVWDAKGLAVPTLGYEDAASRLKFGSREDDEPSQIHAPRGSAHPPKKMILLSMILSNHLRRS
jgi:hypothetical protein